jgi:DNA-binding NarL/FixJ family response regulator
MIRIAVIDDKQVNRKTVQDNLAGNRDIDIVMVGGNGEEFLEKMDAMAPDKRPQLVLMDIDMPVMNGIEAIATGTIKYPEVKFLVLTVFDDDDKIFEAIQAGAGGYLLKDDPASQLIEAINNAIAFNGVPMSPANARKTLQWMRSGEKPATAVSTADIPHKEILSDRETEILKLMVEGLDYKKIARQLFISPLTVRTHTSRIYEKLHVNSKAQAIMLAHKYKWV